MSNTCPFFGKCGGCKYDFASPDYHTAKMGQLHGVPITDAPVWIAPGGRRRADFCFAPNQFGFYQAHSKNIIPVRNCPNLGDKINAIIPSLAALPWNCCGSALVTECENGIDIAITSDVPYFSSEFRAAVMRLDAIRVTWNGRVITQRAQPIINVDGVATPYPAGTFLQPGHAGERAMREIVIAHAAGAHRVADLFCGLGNFTHALNADGFDIVGIGHNRDLFRHPLTVGMLKNYDCVVMDPPRAGAMAQATELAHSDVNRIIYVSCNPTTFMRDAKILTNGGYKLVSLTPVDQFVGSLHWELIGLFTK